MNYSLDAVNVRLSGPENGTKVLLLHGWGGSTESWLPLERDLQKEKRVINIDFPGFGKSLEPEENWCVTEYAALTARLIGKYAPEGTDIIAHSFGGRVALILNTLCPELIHRQVLTGCAGLIPKDGGASNASSLKKLYDNGFTRRVLGDKGVGRIQNFVRSHFGSEDYKNATPLMREVFKNVIAQDLDSYLDAVTAPTLLIWGENDTATPLWMGREMEKRMKDAALIVFEGSGHFAYLQQYNRFYTIVKQFLCGTGE